MSTVVLILKWILVVWLSLGFVSTAAMIGIILIEGADDEHKHETEDNMLS